MESGGELLKSQGYSIYTVNRHSTVTHYQRPNMTHSQEGGTGGEVSEILFFSAKSKRRPSLIYSMQIIPVCLSIVARRKGVSATRRGGLNWTPISLLVGHPCKLFHTSGPLDPFEGGVIGIARALKGRVCQCTFKSDPLLPPNNDHPPAGRKDSWRGAAAGGVSLYRVPLARQEYLAVRVCGKTQRSAETTTRHCQPESEGHTFGADSESEFLGLQLWTSTPVA